MISTATHRIPDSRTLDQLERDEEGFLLDASDWHPDLIPAFAGEDGLVMTPERIEIVDYIRSYFEKNLSVPEARVLLKHLQAVWGKRPPAATCINYSRGVTGSRPARSPACASHAS